MNVKVIFFTYFCFKLSFQSCVGEVATVSNKFKEIGDFGFSQLTTSAVKPRIKPLVDAFLSTSHNITEVSNLIIGVIL